MSGPIDWNAMYGIGSPQFQAELNFYNSYRDQNLQQMAQQGAQRFGMSQLSQSFTGNTAPMAAAQGITPQATPPVADTSWKDEDLVGAATYWGVPEDAARAMPRAHLIDLVNQYRQQARPSDDTLSQRAQTAMLAPSSLAAMSIVGAGEAITGGLQRLPIIGEALGRTKLLHDSDLKLRQYEEAIRSSNPDSMQLALSGANVAGNLAATWYPAAGAANIAGKVIGSSSAWAGLIGATAGPIARAGLQGAGAGWLLMGRDVDGTLSKLVTGQHVDNQEMLESIGIIGGGAVLGAGMKAAEPMFGALANKVARAFSVDEIHSPTDYRSTPTARSAFETANDSPLPVDRQAQIDILTQAANGGDPQAQTMLQYMQGQNGPVNLSSGSAVVDGQTGRGPLHDTSWLGAMDEPGSRPVATQEPDYSPQVGNRPERTPLAPDMGWAPDGSYQQPDVGMGRAVDNMPRVGMRPERINPMAPETGNPSAGLDLEEASNAAAIANKAGTVIESPDFGRVAGQGQIDDMSVAHAAYANNPGGSNLVQGVADPANFVASLGENVRFAQRGTRLDAIVSDQPISDHHVQQYERYGVYEGQRVLTDDGVGGTVRAIENGRAWIDPIYAGAPKSVSVLELHPWTSSPGSVEVPQVWDDFNNYVNQRITATSEAMGGAMTPEQLISVRQANQQQYMQDFFEDSGIINPSDQARVRQYFNLRYVDSFKELVPQETALQQITTAEAAATPDVASPLGRLDQAAATKGFTVVPVHEGEWQVKSYAGTGGQNATTRITFGSQEAAETWIRNLSKELPDVTPESSVPMELTAQHPTMPTQQTNLNIPNTTGMVDSMQSMVHPESGIAQAEVDGIAQAVSKGNIGEAKSRWAEAFSKWSPARRLMSNMGQAMFDITGKDHISPLYDKLTTTLNQHHNEMHPYMNELSDIFKQVKTAPLVNGTWTRLYEMPDIAARDALAATKGINPQTFYQYEGLMQNMFPETGLDEIRQIPQYISHIAQRQSDPELMASAFDNFPLSKTTQPFYEYARTGNLNFREMDPRVLGETYVRSVFWQKNMAAPMEEAKNLVNFLRASPETAPAATVVENWAKIIKQGYTADDDIALDTMHQAMKVLLGPDITRKQAQEVFNFGLNATHSGLLGFRVSVMARDIQQFWLAVPRAGLDMLNVMRRFATSGAARDEIYREALDAGAIVLQSPRMASPGSFGGELEQLGSEGFENAYASADPRMRGAARIAGAIRDMLPASLRDARDTMLHPMYFYGKQSEMMRAIVYKAGQEKAERALLAFRSAGDQADIGALMGESSARTFDPAWQRQFQNLVAAGDDKAAAQFLGRQLADATQFKYGSVESPFVAKSMTGRVATQFGNYPLQYYQYLRESLVNGSITDKAKFLTTMGFVTGGLTAASKSTGWNFNIMNPFVGLNVVAGPWTGVAVDVAAGANSALGALQGRDVNQSRINAMGQAFGSGASMLNPAGGLVWNGRAAMTAAQSPNPMASFLRAQVTGAIDNGPDVQHMLQPGAEQMLMRMMQPVQTPNGNREAAPMIVPQQPTYPVNSVSPLNQNPQFPSTQSPPYDSGSTNPGGSGGFF